MKINGKTVAPAYVNNKQVETGKILKLGNDGLKPGVNKEGQKTQSPGIIKTGAGHDNSSYIKTGSRKLEPAINSVKESKVLLDDDKDRSKLPMSDMHKEGKDGSDDKAPGHTEVKGDIAAGKRDNPISVDAKGKEQITSTIKPLSDLTPEQHETAKALGMSDGEAKVALADFNDAAKDQAHAAWAAKTIAAQGTPEAKAAQQRAANAESAGTVKIEHAHAPTQVAANGTESMQPIPAPQVATAPLPSTPPASTAQQPIAAPVTSAPAAPAVPQAGDTEEQGLGMCDAIKKMTDDEKGTARMLQLSDCQAMSDSKECMAMKDSGKCPESGCVKNVDGKFRVISNKTGKRLPGEHDTEEKAKGAIAAMVMHK